MSSSPQTYTFFIQGMHCKACELLTKSELEEHPGVSSATASLAQKTIQVTGSFGDKTPEQVAEELSAILAPRGYTLSTHARVESVNWNEFVWAVPIAFGFIGLFLLLQKLGIVNFVNTGEMTYRTAFLIGIIASLSSCMAVVGGLLLSLSATFAKEGDRVKPQLLFHGARLVTFFVLGGLIGVLGSVFQLGAVGTFVLGVFVGLVMLILGINLLDLFPGAKRFQVVLPNSVSSRATQLTKLNHMLTPLLVGVASFFLPCGFTQSMQIYTLTTGRFWTGALTMLVFALGTLPVLALLSFSSYRIKQRAASGIFFKTAGIIVMLFAVFNLLNSFAAIGWIDPLFSI